MKYCCGRFQLQRSPFKLLKCQKTVLISFNCVGSLLELALWLSYHDQSFACPGHIFSPLCPIRLIPYQKRAFGKGYVVPISNVFRSKAIAELYIKNYLSRAYIPLGPNSLILYSQRYAMNFVGQGHIGPSKKKIHGGINYFI